MEALFLAFEWYIRDHDKRIEDVEAKLESPAFVETILIAVNKAMQSASSKKVKRFATILGYEQSTKERKEVWKTRQHSSEHWKSLGSGILKR